MSRQQMNLTRGGSMDRFFKLQARLLPELINVAGKRNNILKEIHHSQPIGRRNLAEKLNQTERAIRKELDFLKELGLIEVTASGAVLTEEGEDLLDQLVDYIKLITGISELEEEVANILHIPKVLIVPASHDIKYFKRDLGRFAAGELKKIIFQRLTTENSMTIAVAGGTTMAEVANSMTWDGEKRNITVLPGRGGLGENVDIQANTIAATLARNLGGTYRLLQVPDNLQEPLLSSLSQEPQIKEVLNLLAETQMLIHGVGTTQEMARRRRLSPRAIKYLAELGAVGEAFGFYISEKGQIVHTTTSIGIRLDDLERKDLFVIAIAEGEEKARAIRSVVSPKTHNVLITDENTARKIIQIYGVNL